MVHETIDLNMTKLLYASNKEDICPNCGTACFATDVLCPKCRKNLDDLFEQLPDLEKSNNVLRIASKYLPFWLAPLLIIFSPFIVSLVTALPFALRVRTIPDRDPLQLIWYAVPRSTFVSLGFLLIWVILLFLCTTRSVRVKLGQRLAMMLSILFSILSVIALWASLSIANMMSATYSFGYLGGLVDIYKPASWVHFVSVGGTILIVLNLIAVIGREKTA